MRHLTVLLGAAAVFGAFGCERDNPLYCEDDSVCRDATRAQYDPARLECHHIGHMCYEGCRPGTGDCLDPNRPGYRRGHSYCDPATRDCVRSSADGGAAGPADGGTNRPLGAACERGAACQSGFCVDGVCCDGKCEGRCRSCAVRGNEGTCKLVPDGRDPRKVCGGGDGRCVAVCDGKGACRDARQGDTCDVSACRDGVLTEFLCDKNGGCGPATSGCGGYVCASETACGARCSGDGGCESAFFCDGARCKEDLEVGASCKDNDDACKSGHCAQGVCCQTGCDGLCESCVLPGSVGTCEAVAEGDDPHGHCPGDTTTGTDPCGAGACDGNRACRYDRAGTACGKVCSVHSIIPLTCNERHECTVKGPSEGCSPYKCDPRAGPGRARCFVGCSSNHAECVTDSVCDRSQAHVSGQGDCVDPDHVTWVPQGGKIQDVVSGLVTPVLAVVAGSYTHRVDLTGKTVKLIGAPTPQMPVTVDPSATGPVFTVGAGSDVALQGLDIRGATGSNGVGVGVNCSGSPGKTSRLTLVESAVTGNAGVGISALKCDVILRRNKIQDNSGGGAELLGGQITVVNNLVTGNGNNTSSLVGGFHLSPQRASGNVFVHNTVAYNSTANAAGGGGLNCASVFNVFNNIIFFNGLSPLLSCVAHGSAVEKSAAGNGNIDQDPRFADKATGDFSLEPTSPCVDAGDDSILGPAIDLPGSPRRVARRGRAVLPDMGCYEGQ